MSCIRECYRHLQAAGRALARELRFLRKRLRSDNRCGWDEACGNHALFVLSTGRAGTKLITRLLDQSPLLWVEHAPTPELALQSYLVYRDRPSADALRWSFVHARAEQIARVHTAGLRYVETNNRITLYASAIADILPNARFVHLVRHPAEFVRSGMRRGYYAHMPPALSGHIEPRTDDAAYAKWQNLDRMEKIAWQWNEINASIESFKATTPDSRMLTITSNALFKDSDVLVRLFDFAGIPCPQLSALAQLQSTVINRQRAGNYPPFEEWNQEQRTTLRRWAPLAEQYGFCLDVS